MVLWSGVLMFEARFSMCSPTSPVHLWAVLTQGSAIMRELDECVHIFGYDQDPRLRTPGTLREDGSPHCLGECAGGNWLQCQR
jgi:hypothetical protein